MTTNEIAYKRVLAGKASKAELIVLLNWAEIEIREWQEFKKLIKNKLTTKE